MHQVSTAPGFEAQDHIGAVYISELGRRSEGTLDQRRSGLELFRQIPATQTPCLSSWSFLIIPGQR
jgi:hypothetical protein